MFDWLNNIDALKSDYQKTVDSSYGGEITAINPFLSFTKIPDTTSITQEVVDKDRTMEESLNNFLDAASLEANRSATGIAMAVGKSLAFDSNYNPFNDDVLKAEGENFLSQYGDSFINSPTPEFTRNLIAKIKETEQTKSRLEESGGLATTLGYIAGGITDVTSLIPFVGIGMKGSMLSRMASGALQTGAAVGAGEIAGMEADPTKTAQESVANTIAGAAFGSLMFGAGHLLSKAQSNSAIRALAGDLEDIKLQDENKSIGAAEFNRLYAADEYTHADLMPYGSNRLYSMAQSGLSVFIPEQAMSISPSKTTKYLSDVLTMNNILKGGHLKGKAKADSIESLIEVQYYNKRVQLDDTLVKAQKIAMSEGVDSNITNLVRQAAHDIMDGVESSANKAVEHVRVNIKKMLNEAGEMLANSHRFPEGWKPKADYFPRQLNYNKLVKNQYSFYNDILEQVRKNATTAIERETAEVDAQIIFDNFVKQSTGRKIDPKFMASNLQKRSLEFDSSFFKKYMEDDPLITLNRYFKELYTDQEFFKLFGRGDPKTLVAESINKDYEKLRQSILGSEIDEASKNKSLQALLDNNKKDVENSTKLVDLITGEFKTNESRTLRSAASLMKGISYMRLMGGQALSQIPDIVRAIGFDKFVSKYGKDLEEVVGGSVSKIKLAKDKSAARKLAIMADDWRSSFGQSSRASMMNDIGNVSVETTAERLVRQASNAFNKINLADPMNDWMRYTAAEDVAANIIQWSAKLVKGSLKEGDKGFRELARIGVDEHFAKKIIEQFEKHKSIENKWGGNVVFTNFDQWDSAINLRFSAMIKREADAIIVQPTAGSKPFFMSTSIGSVLGQFKSFMMASASKVFLPTVQKMYGLGGQSAFEAASYVTADLFAGAFTGALRDMVYGRETKTDAKTLALYAFERSNFLSIMATPSAVLDKFGVGAASLLGRQNKSRLSNQGVISSLLGPSAGMVEDVVKTTNRMTDGNITTSDFEKMMKLLPGQNLIWWAWYINNLDGRT